MMDDIHYYDAYWDTKRQSWSIRYDDVLLEHFNACFMYEAVQHILPGRQCIARRDRRRLANAFLASTVRPTRYHMLDSSNFYEIRYDVFRMTEFMVIKNGEFHKFSKAYLVHFTPEGKIYCKRFE